ncbi:hypothetical protein [Ruegeria sp. Alg231-54]|uniref:hypothetical protein n=1 Tax=Ruegeria sp. Alg231-54 TaxID=1922221 RepID=UPI000D553DEA|nr:hypothetical protein [Ruegeria sp. Alg231-54]
MQQYAVDGVLAGATLGQQVFMKLLDDCKVAPPTPSVLLVDFVEVELATASFLRESVFALKDHMRARSSNWYPVFANVMPEVEEEFAVLTEARRDAVILCNCNAAETISCPRLFGDLDPKHARTFEFVAKEGEADAGSLAVTYGAQEELEKPTAWNNRLKSLVERGVLMEITKGRAKTYRPAW